MNVARAETLQWYLIKQTFFMVALIPIKNQKRTNKWGCIGGRWHHHAIPHLVPGNGQDACGTGGSPAVSGSSPSSATSTGRVGALLVAGAWVGDWGLVLFGNYSMYKCPYSRWKCKMIHWKIWKNDLAWSCCWKSGRFQWVAVVAGEAWHIPQPCTCSTNQHLPLQNLSPHDCLIFVGCVWSWQPPKPTVSPT